MNILIFNFLLRVSNPGVSSSERRWYIQLWWAGYRSRYSDWLEGPGIESRWGARFSAPLQTGPVAHPASCTMGTASFPGVRSGRGVTLTTHPLLVPWSWKSTAIPLLPLWAVRPVQSLSACTRVHFTFIYSYATLRSTHQYKQSSRYKSYIRYR